MTVIVDGERIVAVQTGYAAPAAGDTVIDLKQATVTPSWIDCHVHLSGEQSPTRYTEGFFMNPADFALRATVYARKTLQAGFTTVRDCGSAHNLNRSLRKAIAAGYIEGPRIYAAGAVATTGGHGDGTNGYNDILQEVLATKATGIANGPDDPARCPPAVQGWRRSHQDFGHGRRAVAREERRCPAVHREELRAVVETARDYGLKVAAHAHGTEGMKRAILAGSPIEHGTFMSDEVIALMKKHGTTTCRPSARAIRWENQNRRLLSRGGAPESRDDRAADQATFHAPMPPA